MALPLPRKHSKEVASADTERRSPWLFSSDFKTILNTSDSLRGDASPHPCHSSRGSRKSQRAIDHYSANHILTDGRQSSDLLSGIPRGDDQWRGGLARTQILASTILHPWPGARAKMGFMSSSSISGISSTSRETRSNTSSIASRSAAG